MFEHLKRELKKLDRTFTVSIDLPLDDKGYLDRRCPHRECGSGFKVLYQDWRDKVPDESAHCPKCGTSREAIEFNTPWQNEHVKREGQRFMQKQLDQAMRAGVRKSRPMRIGGGMLGISASLSYRSSRPILPLFPETDDVLRQDLTCESCGCRFATLGAGYFCPACGHHSPVDDVKRTIELARHAIDCLDDLTTALTARTDADVAANFEQQLLENQIEDLVSAFQRGTEALYDRLPNAVPAGRDLNRFQRLATGSDLWRDACGTGYDRFVSSAELSTLGTMIQRRHKLGHTQGIVDEKYVQTSGDASYAVGQRLVITRRQVLDLAAVLEKLFAGLGTPTDGSNERTQSETD